MRQNIDYHYYGSLRSSCLGGWSCQPFYGTDTPNVSTAGLFSCHLSAGFPDWSNYQLVLGSPAAELENQFVVYIYISVEK